MVDLFVLGFPTREKAEAVMEVAGDLQKQELLDLEDAALVWRTSDGKIKVQQAYNPDNGRCSRRGHVPACSSA